MFGASVASGRLLKALQINFWRVLDRFLKQNGAILRHKRDLSVDIPASIQLQKIKKEA